MPDKLKFLYYTPIPWRHLKQRLPSFPHSNLAYTSDEGKALYNEALDLFKYAETVGFDWLGVGEEHMNVYGIVPNPCLIASALSKITTKAKICVLGNPLPLLNPLRVAEEYAMVDVLSNGRLVAGFPRGVPQNYLAYGVDPDQSREQLKEAVAFVTTAWKTKGPFNWDGRFYQYKDVSIWPQPEATPEMVFSAKSIESIELSVSYKGVLAELYVKNKAVYDHFKTGIVEYCKLSREQGWASDASRFLINIPCFVAATDSMAKEKAEKALDYVRNVISGSFESQKEQLGDSYYKGTAELNKNVAETLEDRISYGGVVCGSPQTVVGQIKRLVEDTGVGILGLQMQVGDISYNAVRESLHLFGKYVKDYVTG